MINIDHFLATAGCGATTELQELLDKGAQINGKNVHGLTALMMASQNGHIGAVQFLLSRGADVNAKDKDGDTALKLATQYGPHPEVQDLLRKAGAK
jgi:ankyrin repeat protein